MLCRVIPAAIVTDQKLLAEISVKRAQNQVGAFLYRNRTDVVVLDPGAAPSYRAMEAKIWLCLRVD